MPGVVGLLLALVGCHVGARLRSDRLALVWLLHALVVAAVIQALAGLLQWAGLVGDLYHWLPEPGRRGIAFGTLRQPNLFATFLCVGAVCVAWLLQLQRLSVAMAWSALSVLLFAVAASGSRTGLICVLCLGYIGWSYRNRHAVSVMRLMLGAVLLTGVAMIALSGLASLLDFGFESSVQRSTRTATDARIVIWQSALELIRQRPWTGWGWAETGYAFYSGMPVNRFDGLIDNVHMLPLQLALEFGLPATLTVSAFVGCCLYIHLPQRSTLLTVTSPLHTSTDTHFAWGILLLIVGVHSMLEYPLWHAGFLFIVGVSIGYVLHSPSQPYPMQFFAVGSRKLPSLLSAALFVTSIFAWQQYTTLLPIYQMPFTNDRAMYRSALTAALNKASHAKLYQHQLDFAALAVQEVTLQNAVEIRVTAERLLHHRAEPRVLNQLLLSLWYLQDTPALRSHATRYCAAWPLAFQSWLQLYQEPKMLDMLGLSVLDTCLRTTAQ